jgi:glycosyltransferase involved in cell wall biosynthesis
MHHLLYFGLESLYVIRAALPQARIVLTLHDYYLICANHGQLYKFELKERCDGPELQQCRKCLPDRQARDFELRALDIRNALSICDQIVSPSWFLKAKFEQYFGGPIDIRVIENGYVGPTEHLGTSPSADVVTFAYFGNIAPIKGLGDLLEAADILQESRRGGFHLAVHGSQLFPDRPLEERMNKSRESLGRQLRFLGRYKTDDLGQLLSKVNCVVFPSVWWENAPLVIYEALYHRCQIIAYPHGGAAEILKRYGFGIIAERSDPQALADAMATVLDAPSNRGGTFLQIPGRRDLLANYAAIYFQAA